MPITIHPDRFSLPLIKIDNKVYFILGGTYQRLHNEKMIDEKYTVSGDISRQMRNTECHRWKMTLIVPTSTYNIDTSSDYSGYDYGVIDTLHTTADKTSPSDLLNYWDITMSEDFSSTYSHRVYISLDWETPWNNDPGTWQIPIELWGYDS